MIYAYFEQGTNFSEFFSQDFNYQISTLMSMSKVQQSKSKTWARCLCMVLYDGRIKPMMCLKLFLFQVYQKIQQCRKICFQL